MMELSRSYTGKLPGGNFRRGMCVYSTWKELYTEEFPMRRENSHGG